MTTTTTVSAITDPVQASMLIDSLGGTKRVAALCSVRAPSISQWRRRGIPRPWALFFHAKYPERFDPAGNFVGSDAPLENE
ncbi:hypothetical protein CEE60_02825 [Stenotrophomonas maltophilia]|uniref:Rha family transcriptional regulator n=1 Tax=Stenotrophomonas maltophilia TaxID=40324 RepID=A0A246HR20_STEMA|nr:hypothetical protein [Stenotrophomonas maltophilia]OWQ56425.1 hypothetical protein CEE60_02825 [Stenotrophomonas maltophilia]